MSKPDLHKFREDLSKKPPNGSNAPPRTVRAKDLDENFEKVTIVESTDIDPVPYQVEYTKNGTRLVNMRPLPFGAKSKAFHVCENGEPRSYWLLVWDREPNLPQ